MTYAALKTDVATYLHRSDLTALIPAFVERAEAYLFRELQQIKDLAASATGTTTGEYATLPTDFGSVSKLTVTYGSTEYTLDYKDETAVAATTVPYLYALENNQLRIFGASTGQTYTLYYTAKLAALSDSNTTNWLLTNAPDLYLYATAMEGAKHIRDEAEIARCAGYVAQAVESVRRSSERKGQPTKGALQIKPRHCV